MRTARTRIVSVAAPPECTTAFRHQFAGDQDHILADRVELPDFAERSSDERRGASLAPDVQQHQFALSL